MPDDGLALTVEFAIDAIDAQRPGVLAEFGTWMGGASFAMLLAQRYRYGSIVKPVWMFDSFQGLPPVDARDGPLASKYQNEPDSPMYRDNCTAPLTSVRKAAAQFGFSEQEAVIIPGWFKDTVPQTLAALRHCGISMLRIDCDWYEPVLYVLENMVPLVPEDGRIILDDYFAWDGCALATHDFLSANKLSYRIRSLPSFYCAWMCKQAFRRA